MKQYLQNSLRALFLSLSVLLSLPMLAEVVEINGINYDLIPKEKVATVIAKNTGSYSGVIVIPESVEHEGATYSVTCIGEGAFWDCSGLTSVTIGNNVTSIEYGAFYGCSGLTSLTIGNSVTSIGDVAFRKCSGLTSVTIPNSVTIL
ncbi:MAG: leucine-rich repeat domain-containing protein [Bacteroidaceae bacterium]|nr:leucine-rich repeat domain-containing protein [Bacteroidaceae bacterium]